ncbi:hypothetical protein MPL3356_270102 [Mesorhizobium plurifarium]|uniref:Uncharacterized protein n=1 Tax=Mesorhizobium plurifarium TaxID=69974 RepID=A0A090FHF3_MESPL|nr:hypothetical protein MPL3356_270102 [Mesorhizobium plurifarium]CDX21047.1 hypothetical protein MPLB_1990060 [Mesorhizobium sp. ORS 3324]CDX44937.1 hypothetical protein MPLA_750020 [Mesorhizobium sp. ORS 3359]CDX52633.1 hypothetical protein MPL3365_170002 [Mesorhizobium plurifarium]
MPSRNYFRATHPHPNRPCRLSDIVGFHSPALADAIVREWWFGTFPFTPGGQHAGAVSLMYLAGGSGHGLSTFPQRRLGHRANLDRGESTTKWILPLRTGAALAVLTGSRPDALRPVRCSSG